MSLLTEVQASLLCDQGSLGPALLKLKFLASRIGSDVLEDWVRHEIEGYPSDVPVPDYRKIGLVFTCTLSNMVYIRQGAPIPGYLIAKYAGDSWLTHNLREGMDVIDRTIEKSEDKAQYSVDASNLLLLLQDKIYEDHSIMDINARFDVRAFVRVQSAVRAKMLDLTIRLEKDVPGVKEITVKENVSSLPADAARAANNATQAVIHNYTGPVTQITNSGTVGSITVSNTAGDISGFVREFVSRGAPEAEVKELAEIVKSEKPESPSGKELNRLNRM